MVKMFLFLVSRVALTLSEDDVWSIKDGTAGTAN